MTDNEEAIIYGAMVSMQNNCKAILDLVNDHGTPEQKVAYKEGMYAVAMKLGMVLMPDAIERQKENRAKSRAKMDAYFEGRKEEVKS